ncbi:hypothetical protein CERZMDRAFT_93979 [Cercospora zeae-maydis SCOH1-5]|uniref:Zn(2)-C6 fungal-type domain-containing protein n=1 Tax=Cercospora zeae-maydis SCOH1-5 TaxID=717836 RepID=A0A6A6FQK2_9PEZI|nr:hypothetical protein CERZMDRAFT_93979 [Cercospora zeae-maydis SCOH1-5]
MSASGHSRPLLAARSSSGDASKDGSSNTSNANAPGPTRPPSGRPKRTLIESACSACRRRKSRCDGLRPSCSRCQNLRTDCQYEAEEGESRWSALRRRNQLLEQERDHIRELLAFVQTRPEPEALDIFQRIRTSSYDDIFLLLRQVREGAYGMQPGLQQQQQQQQQHMPPGPPPGNAIDHRLPPIQAILEVSSRQGVNGPAHPHPNHAHLVQSHSVSSEESRNSSIPEFSPGAASAPHMLSTLEPSPHHPRHQTAPHHPTNTPPLMGSKPSLSSEESTGSVTSNPVLNPGFGMDLSKPYQTP